MSVELLTSPLLNKCDSLCHFITTTKGGVSSGTYSTFNLGLYSGDTPENILENRKRLAFTIGLPLENLFFPYQTHGTSVRVIDEAFLNLTIDEQNNLLNGVDAIVTNVPNVCIGVTTADCVPILIYDARLSVFATIHAGWRGLVAGIIDDTVKMMENRFGSKAIDMFSVIGPAISVDHFEVGEEVVEAFINSGFPINEVGTRNNISGKMHIDLHQAARISLQNLGVLEMNIDVLDICTYISGESMFSARRQGVKSGRIVSGGYLKSN